MKNKSYKPRGCATCAEVFMPSNSNNVYCSLLCRLLGFCDHSGGELACWPWLKSTNSGYGQLMLSEGGKYRPILAHRAMMQELTGRVLSCDDAVMHHCDNRICINPSHLEIADRAKNNEDARVKGRHGHGELKGSETTNATIDEEMARQVFEAKGKMTNIAMHLGVSYPIVTAIRGGRTWNHVTGLPRKSYPHH